MRKITLTEKEIEAIKRFAKDIDFYKIITGVYISAFDYKEKDAIEVVAVYDDFGLDLNSKKDIIVDSTDVNIFELSIPDVEDFVREITVLKSDLMILLRLNLDRVKFSVIHCDKFSSYNMVYDGYTVGRSLLSGTILYDKDGKLDNYQKEAKIIQRPYINTLEIENIDELLKNINNKEDSEKEIEVKDKKGFGIKKKVKKKL